MPAVNDGCKRTVAGVRKPPRNEPAGDVRGRRGALSYGDLVDAEGGREESERALVRAARQLAENRRPGSWLRWSGVVVCGFKRLRIGMRVPERVPGAVRFQQLIQYSFALLDRLGPKVFTSISRRSKAYSWAEPYTRLRMSNLKSGMPWSSQATASPSIRQERQRRPATASAMSLKRCVQS